MVGAVVEPGTSDAVRFIDMETDARLPVTAAVGERPPFGAIERLNADFEDHAEHEYALLVREHPEWEDTPYEGSVNDDYGDYASLADLFRQIGDDEQLHKLESEGQMERARFD